MSASIDQLLAQVIALRETPLAAAGQTPFQRRLRRLELDVRRIARAAAPGEGGIADDDDQLEEEGSEAQRSRQAELDAAYERGARDKAFAISELQRTRRQQQQQQQKQGQPQPQRPSPSATGIDPGASDWHLRYINELLTSSCAADLMDSQVFNISGAAKELTEAFAAYAAVRSHLLGPDGFDLHDQSVVVLVVGDGSTPRAGATFALRSTWQVHSIDPQMRTTGPWQTVQRLRTHSARVQDIECVDADRVIVVMVHCHVAMDEALAVLKRRPARLGVVAAPCCDYAERQTHVYGLPPMIEYDDVSIASARRLIRVWLVHAT